MAFYEEVWFYVTVAGAIGIGVLIAVLRARNGGGKEDLLTYQPIKQAVAVVPPVVEKMAAVKPPTVEQDIEDIREAVRPTVASAAVPEIIVAKDDYVAELYNKKPARYSPTSYKKEPAAYKSELPAVLGSLYQRMSDTYDKLNKIYKALFPKEYVREYRRGG